VGNVADPHPDLNLFDGSGFGTKIFIPDLDPAIHNYLGIKKIRPLSKLINLGVKKAIQHH
jgi:hypothetical protein